MHRYRPLGTRDAPGYVSHHLEGEIWEVIYKGDEHCRDEVALDLALLRAAELTLEQEFACFEVLECSTGNKVLPGVIAVTRGRVRTTPIVSPATGNTGTLVTVESDSTAITPTWRLPEVSLKIRLLHESDAATPSGEIRDAGDLALELRTKHRIP